MNMIKSCTKLSKKLIKILRISITSMMLLSIKGIITILPKSQILKISLKAKKIFFSVLGLIRIISEVGETAHVVKIVTLQA